MASPPPSDPLAQFLEGLEREASERRHDGLERTLEPPAGIDFSSNDSLGLSRDPRLARAMEAALRAGPGGAPASRLLRGHLEAHRECEERLARWKGTDGALLFSSGYTANLGLLGALVRREDRALSDALNHASLIDGLRLAGCRREIYRHLDLDAVERLLRSPHPGGRTFLVTETLFGMDGDRAPLAELARLARSRGALLILDDAHATGLYGARGSGLAEEAGIVEECAAIVSTGGKALGLGGAFVAAPRAVLDTLVNRARAFIFSTAMPPVLAAGIARAAEIAQREPERRARALALAGRLRARLRERDVAAGGAGSPIVPVLIGGNEAALRAAERIRSAGFDVRAIRPPSVPAGTARLRISVHADRLEREIDGLAMATSEALAAEAPLAAGGAGAGERLR